MNSTATLTATQVVAKCRNGHFVRGSWDDAGRNGGWLLCGCGARVIAKGFEVKLTETTCGARCTSALGFVCDCSCGGEAHGEDHRA
jgi:hypothetical protein